MNLPNDWQKYALGIDRIIDTNEGDFIVSDESSFPIPMSNMRYLVDAPVFENWHDHSKGWLIFIPNDLVEEAIEGEVINEN